MKRPDAWQSNQGKGYTAKDAARVFYTERGNMTRKRLNVLVDLVLKCRDIDDVDVSISIGKYGSEVDIWTKELVDGFKMTIYGTGAFARNGINEKNSEIRNIIDPDLKMAEERMRRLLDVQVF